MKQKIIKKVQSLRKVLRAHQLFSVTFVFLLILIVMVLRIRHLSDLPPDQGYIDEQLLKTKTVNFNQQAIEDIQALRDSNVSVPDSQLPGNRQNPFSE